MSFVSSFTDPVRFAPVILAGGSGTRFWPRSRRARAKQVLALDGEHTMIQETLRRLIPLAQPSDMWVITNALLCSEIARQLPSLPTSQLLSEPAARNTAPACALAAFLLERTQPATVLGIFPSDHVVADTDRFTKVLRAGVEVASRGPFIVVLGVPPTRPETGYGYIAQGEQIDDPTLGPTAPRLRRVVRFTEKPDRQRAEEFLLTGDFAWNSGIFLWRADTLADAIREHCPELVEPLERIAAAFGTPEFDRVFREEYPSCKNISIDYAVLEPRSARGAQASGIVCLPADFGWNDLGSWDSLYEYRASSLMDVQTNVVESLGTLAVEASGNYIHAPGKMVALLGVENLVVVETGDALLVTTRERSQDVGRLTRALAEAGHEHLT